MTIPNFGNVLADTTKKRLYLCNFVVVAALFLTAYLFSSSTSVSKYKHTSTQLLMQEPVGNEKTRSCKLRNKPPGSEPLPQGIIARKTNLEMLQKQGSTRSEVKDIPNTFKRKLSKSLLAMAVGIKQKEVVNQIVQKFPSQHFTVMLFHYDGTVDNWRDLAWSDIVLHVSAVNQTKWWFAKRFLHPDIVTEYDYIFLWDEDLGVEHFDPVRYISIVNREKLHVSQPALDAIESEVHHQITARWRRGDVHRRTFKSKSGGGCNETSNAPPCTGWVEMMAPVFSKAAWRCVWYMIQNDLIHAWGLDMKLGYCAQGSRSQNIGVVDSEYIVHLGIPTLGGADGNTTNTESTAHLSASESQRKMVPSGSSSNDVRYSVRRRSYAELILFQQRWKNAVARDMCWKDPYPDSPEV